MYMWCPRCPEEEADGGDGRGPKELPLVEGTGAVNLDSIHEYESGDGFPQFLVRTETLGLIGSSLPV